MADGYTPAELQAFLDYLGDKGLANKNTVASRKASVSKVLGILGPDEASDLRGLDLDALMGRFANLQGKNYSPDSLRVYKSRLSRSLEDFLRYKENPANFKPTGSQQTKPSRPVMSKQSKPETYQSETSSESPSVLIKRANTIDIPVALRPDCVIQINGVPIDLKQSEAKKIANVIMAMATISEE